MSNEAKNEIVKFAVALRDTWVAGDEHAEGHAAEMLLLAIENAEAE